MLSEISNIVVIEPRFTGFVHAAVNSGVIAALSEGFPGVKIEFRAEAGHGMIAREYLRSSGFDVAKVLFSQLTMSEAIAKPIGLRACRLEQEFLDQQLSDLESGTLVVLMSITPNLLYYLKPGGGSRRHSNLSFFVIEHDLPLVLTSAPRRPWLWNRGYRRILLSGAESNFKLVVLGESLVISLKKLVRQENVALNSIHHPKLCCGDNLSSAECSSIPRKFLYLGASAKGFDKFLHIARNVKAMRNDYEFRFAGFINSDIPADATNFVSGLQAQSLTYYELESRLAQSDVVVWTGDSREYSLRSSGTFVDAMVAGRPVLGLYNDFAKYYFDRFGGAGALFENVSSLADAIVSLDQTHLGWPVARWRQNCREIAKVFAPKSVGDQIRKIVNKIE